MIVILGGSGYIGSAFRSVLQSRGVRYTSISRRDFNYYDRDRLIRLLREARATFLVNAAGVTGRPNVDACESNMSDCLLGNVVLPVVVRSACQSLGIPWGHFSSGCIYQGSRIEGGGFRECDPPNFSFMQPDCSFYSGSKVLAEQALADCDNVYIWRIRMPFDSSSHSRNYLQKLLHYDRLLDARNSLSQLDECIDACWRCWELRVPAGIYNVTNGGSITTREIVEMLKCQKSLRRAFVFFESESEFMNGVVVAKRSFCELDNSKLLSVGITVSHVRDAIHNSIEKLSCI